VLLVCGKGKGTEGGAAHRGRGRAWVDRREGRSLRVDGEGRPAVVERRQVEDGLAGCGSPGC